MKNILIITGSNGFIGQNLTDYLLERFETIYLLDVSNNEEDQQSDNLRYVKFDITNENSVLNFFNNLKTEKINSASLINLAAKDHKVGKEGEEFNWSIDNANVDDLRNNLEISIIGTFLVTKYFCKLIVDNDLSGKVINFASDLSVIISNDSVYSSDTHKPIDYSISKHGLIGLTKYFAVYYAKYNITVNAISPTGIFNNQSEEFISKYSSQIPKGRMLKVEEIFSAVDFLLNEESTFITGQNIIIDGGRTLW